MLLLIYRIDALLKPLFFIDVDDSKSLNVSVSIIIIKTGTADCGPWTADWV